MARVGIRVGAEKTHSRACRVVRWISSCNTCHTHGAESVSGVVETHLNKNVLSWTRLLSYQFTFACRYEYDKTGARPREMFPAQKKGCRPKTVASRKSPPPTGSRSGAPLEEETRLSGKSLRCKCQRLRGCSTSRLKRQGD